MEISPQTIRSIGFKTVKKGYDPEEVESFRSQVAGAVETAQNQATAMEARARAAVAKLQEMSQQVQGGARDAVAPAHTGDTEMISRTLLMAQRTADAAIVEARAEADTITAHAREEASRVLDSARVMAATTIDDARAEARRAVDDERVKAENEVQALLARRDFLLSDVDHLEQYLQTQRERLRDAAVHLQELVDRVPGGLGEMRRPLLSASAEPLPASLQPLEPAVSTPEPAAPVASPVEPEVIDPDPSPLFTTMPDRPVTRTDMALSSKGDAKENVWRLLDEEVASTEAAQESFALDEVTAEVPAQTAAAPQRDPFRIGGDELQ